jgi:hypothetical protein
MVELPVGANGARRLGQDAQLAPEEREHMRLTRLRAELRAQRYGIAIGTVALLVAVGVPAQALEGATSAVNSVAKALRIAKKADRRSKEALRLAQEVSKAPGPRGPQGPAGSDAQFNGAPAGGGLAGAYPNPMIAQNAIGTAQVTNDALSGSDIVEGSLGQVPSALAATNAQNIADKSVTASSFGTITKRLPGAVSRFCSAKASARQATWRWGSSDDSRTPSSSPESLPLSATHE